MPELWDLYTENREPTGSFTAEVTGFYMYGYETAKGINS